MLNNKNNRLGFSLLANILVSLGIIVLLSAISIPYIRRYQPSLKLSAATKDLAGDLRLAQQLTITEQVPHAVDLDLFNQDYQILSLDTATSTIKNIALDSEISFNAGTTVSFVEFNSYGAVTGESVGTIVLANSQGDTASINIKPSGYIEVEN